eukprot:56286-Pleurochrysis_carterae.AAC.2
MIGATLARSAPLVHRPSPAHAGSPLRERAPALLTHAQGASPLLSFRPRAQPQSLRHHVRAQIAPRVEHTESAPSQCARPKSMRDQQMSTHALERRQVQSFLRVLAECLLLDS